MVKEKIKNHIGNFHLYILTGLILVFFGVLFLSTAFKDVTEKYEFQEEVVVSDSENIDIGSIYLTNNGPITAKVELNKLVACDNNDNINLKFTGTKSNNDIFGYSNSISLEIGAKKSEELKIIGSKYVYYEKFEKNISELNLDLYIYELEKDQNTYDYCHTANKANAIANVKVKVIE